MMPSIGFADMPSRQLPYSCDNDIRVDLDDRRRDKLLRRNLERHRKS